MIRFLIFITCLVLAACVHDQQPAITQASAAPAPKAEPAKAYFKQGASNEEFQRTKAACLLRSDEAQNANPNSLTWISIFPLCMRANGWVLAPIAKPVPKPWEQDYAKEGNTWRAIPQ